MEKYALGFSLSNLGPKSFQKVLNRFDSLEKAWNGTQKEFAEIEIILKTYETFDKFRKLFDIDSYVEKMKKEKVSFISFLDKNYPYELKKLPDPPIGIYCKGNLSLLPRHPELRCPREDEYSWGVSGSYEIPDQVRNDKIKPASKTNNGDNSLKIAVVGTRKVTQYGRDVTEFLVSELVKNGVCIVSGLALGVDGIAHRTAIENNGNAIAVLACGVDCCLPSENYSLHQLILEHNGLIISEYPLSQPPNKGTFLARNRIVAAISDGVLITEAAEGSGSLVTAEWGLRLGKKVFAVPGPITSKMSDGSLKLLKQGAKLVSSAQDILEEFITHNSEFRTATQKFGNLKLSKEEKKIVSLLENEGLTIDEIVKKTNLPISKIFISISNLELKGIVKNENGRVGLKI